MSYSINKSQDLFERAQEFIPGGVTPQYVLLKALVEPLFSSSAVKVHVYSMPMIIAISTTSVLGGL